MNVSLHIEPERSYLKIWTVSIISTNIPLIDKYLHFYYLTECLRHWKIRGKYDK
jgi:hypothetical protein